MTQTPESEPVSKIDLSQATESVTRYVDHSSNKLEGRKDDSGKNRVDLLPVDALEEVSKVLTFGARKYADRNWEKGMAWSRVYGACIRHLWAFWRGEETDPESGLSHLAHAMCCVMFLLSYRLRSTPGDDRPL